MSPYLGIVIPEKQKCCYQRPVGAPHKTRRRLSVNCALGQMAATLPTARIQLVASSLKLTNVRRTNAHTNDFARNFAAGSYAFCRECHGIDHRYRGRGQNRYSGTGRGADAAPLLAAGGDLYPNGAAR